MRFQTVIKDYWAIKDSIVIDDGILTRKWESSDGKTYLRHIILPSKKIPQLLQEFHCGTSSGHLGIHKTLPDQIKVLLVRKQC